MVLCFAKYKNGFLIPPHLLINFEIQKYYQNEPRFNGVYSRENLPKIKDGALIKEVKSRNKNLAMAWIDYKKAYDMVPHSWIIECLDLFGVAENIKSLLVNSMEKWKVMLCSGNSELGVVEIKRGIFQGDSLSPLVFVLALIPLSLILRKAKAAYEFSESKEKINHLLFMDDLKLYSRS